MKPLLRQTVQKLISGKPPFRRIKLQDRHRAILGMIRENTGRLLLAMGCMMVVAVTSAATAFLVKPVLDDIFISRDKGMLLTIPAAVILIYFLRGAGTYGQEYLMNHVGQDIIRRLRNQLYDHIQDLPVSFFQGERTGVLMSRITNDVNIIKNMVSSSVTSTIRDFFTIVFLTGVIFYRDWKMAIFAFVVLPAAFYPIVEFGRRVRRISTGVQEAMAEMSAFLHETFTGNKIVKAFGREDYEKDRFAVRTRRLFDLEMRQVRINALSSPVMEFLAGIGIAFIIWYGGSRVVEGASTAGTFFSFMAAVLMLYDPVKKLSKVNNQVQQGLAAADRVFDVIEREPDVVEAADPVQIADGPHRVRLESVSLSYDGGRTWALQEVDLDVAAGDVVALVGGSGGGKTSLVNLIPRFYDAASGRIRVDDVDVRDAAVASLRRQIALVTQEAILFDDTIAANIAYGRPDATPDDVIAAAKAAFADDFIRAFPDGYETRIGELGGRLSGGQKQRLCIARALLKDAPILILDEATSALDAESELWVQKALENLMCGRTTFVIAHRLSTIRHADRIVVLADGRIVEEGGREDLLRRNGEYAKLHRMQFSGAGS